MNNFSDNWVAILVGVAIGWGTKVPFLLKWYKRVRKDKEHIREIVENYKKHFPPTGTNIDGSPSKTIL